MTNTVTIVESNNTVSILEDAPVVTPEPWYQNLKTVPTSSGSATVTAGGTSHTKGAWTEIIASNAAETTALLFRISGVYQSSNDTSTLIDVAVGASGSEIALAENVAVGGASDVVFVLPAKVAVSARIAVRSQALIASDTAGVSIETLAMGNATAVGTTFDVLGTSTATSAGTQLANSYVEVVAATSQEYEALIVVESFTLPTASSQTQTISVATGAAGVETEIARKYITLTTVESVATQTRSGFVGSISRASIPAGTRLSAKNDNTRLPDITIIGVPAV